MAGTKAGAIGYDPAPEAGQHLRELRRRRVAVAQVHGHDIGAVCDRTTAAQRSHHRGEGGQVEMVGPVIGDVTEGLFEQDDVVRPTCRRAQGGLRQWPGVRRVQQPAVVGAGDVEQQPGSGGSGDEPNVAGR